MELSEITSIARPVLCIDTCSLLDIMRDPTRDATNVNEMQTAIDLVAHAEQGHLICLMADQVGKEFREHEVSVQTEAEKELKKLVRKIEMINEVSRALGLENDVDLTHLDNHTDKARAIVERWLHQLQCIVPQPDIYSKVFLRVNECRAPAKRGKESSKDCLVYETYLEAATSLRSGGLKTPIVFLSSNTKEYRGTGGNLIREVESEFSTLSISYASNMQAAKHFLGL